MNEQLNIALDRLIKACTVDKRRVRMEVALILAATALGFLLTLLFK